MTVVGIYDGLVTNLSTIATGAALDYASKAAFLSDGWLLTWMDVDGVDLASQPTWDLVRSDTDGDHQFKAEVPYGWYRSKLTVPAGKYATVTNWIGRGTNYGNDDIGGMIASAGAVTVTPTVTSDTATMFDGDSLDFDVSVTESALASIGAASLAACDTRRAYIKLDSTAAGAAPTVDYTDLTVTILTDTSGDRTLSITKDAFPTALAVPSTTKAVNCTLMLELGEGTKVIMAAEVAITILWSSRDGAGS